MTEESAIVTPRLILRRPVESDFADLFALWTDAETLRHIGKPATREEAWARFLKYVGHWAMLGFGYRVVIEVATRHFIGEIGIARQRRSARPDDELEVGWALLPSAQGKGFAKEGLAASLNWADDTLATSRTICLIAPENHPSIRLATACGYGHFGGYRLHEADMMLYERIAS